MKLIKIGNRYINPDHVQSVVNMTTYVRFYFSGFIERDDGSIEYDYIDFNADKAEDVRRWLARNSEDVSDPQWSDEAYYIYMKRGGSESYGDWQILQGRLMEYLAKPESWFDDPAHRALVSELETLK